NNAALAAAGAREDAAWAARDRAGSERWPQLRLDSRVSHVSEVPEIQLPLPGLGPMTLAEPDTWVTTATLQQTVFTGGRLRAQVRQAGEGAEGARAARQRARQSVAFAAERAFLGLLAAQEESGVAAKTLAAAESHLRVANERLAARAAARFDVLRAEVQVEEARQDAIRADGALLSARALLLQALGLETGEFDAVAPARPPAGGARPDLGLLLDEGRRLRPDLEALRRQVAAAAAGVRAARAERMPTLAVAADYLYAEPESRTLFSRWSVGAAVSLPVLDGGRAAAKRGEAAAALVQAEAALDAQLRAVESEVRQAYARAASADAQVQVAERRVAQAEELLRLADVRFAGGAGTATEVADAQASLARARYGATRAAAEQGVAAAELALAVGATRTEPSGGGEAGRPAGAAGQVDAGGRR
ncbi:MAG TPA: TolC family protein, partial [bacterium]